MYKRHWKGGRISFAEMMEDDMDNQKAKGPPGHCFWATMFAISVLTIGNFFMMITLYKVLRLSSGMESLEVDPEHHMTSFYNDVTLDSVLKLDGEIKVFSDESFHLEGDNGEVVIKVQPSEDNSWSRVDPSVEVGLDTISVKDFERLDIKDKNGQSIFSTKLPQFGLPSGVQRLEISSATAERFVSPKNSSLLVQSDANIRFKGNEGMNMNGRDVHFSADKDIMLHSINGSVVFGGHHGIILDVKKLPSSAKSSEDRSSLESDEDSISSRSGRNYTPLSQYKLCICMPEGRLFKIPIPVGNGESSGSGRISCLSVDMGNSRNNPCI